MSMKPSQTLLASALAAIVLLVYSNHFENPFHFDDSHTIVENPHIRSLSSLPRFFTDSTTFSSLPANRAYRPLIPASLAIDYAIAGGLKPFVFQLSTFLWFMLQLWLMLWLYRRMAGDSEAAAWIALLATGLYGLHPAIAETVNYVIQRADVYSTLGVVAGLVVWARWPGARRFGLYLLPVAAALLSKPPALVFPALLFLFVWLVEGQRPRQALRAAVPALLLAAALLGLISAMTPKSFTPSMYSPLAYRLTQPVVALGYFRTFFLPTHLTADSGRLPVSSLLEGDAWLGFLFLGALLAATVWCLRRSDWRPAGFGLLWFLVALLPTAVFPLAEVENDHRMYFPFVGLTFSVVWAAARLAGRLRWRPPIVAGVCAVVLAAYGYGTFERNRVWQSDESLWRDVSKKSPHNGRGLMNYGLAVMARGDVAKALEYFERSLVYNPNYYILEINLGIACGRLRPPAEAERHFQRALALAPQDALGPFYYARWLNQQQRKLEAVRLLDRALRANPDALQAHYLKMQIYADLGQAAALQQAATALLGRFPDDAKAREWLARAGSLPLPAPEAWLNLSLEYYRARQFEECIAAANQALRQRPEYADAWNNIAAAQAELGRWEAAIEAARRALAINPNYALARNNLDWAEAGARKARR